MAIVAGDSVHSNTRRTDEVAIIERYSDYSPPVDMKRTVRLLLHYVPSEYLAGIQSIVLTNATSSRQLRRGKTWARRRKVRMTDCNGFYRGDHIELLVDNLFRGLPRWWILCSVTRNICVGYTLYHEIGHNIHAVRVPVRREKEDVAEEWGGRLLGSFMRRRYRYLKPVWPAMRYFLLLLLPQEMRR